MTSNTIAAIFLFAGVILLIVEAFIPDFGIIGLSGIACIVTAILIFANSVFQVILFLAIFAAVLGLMVFLLADFLGKRGSRLVLRSTEAPEEGYTALRNDSELVGKKGIADTDLHPSGGVKIDGERLDVVTSGEYIKRGTKVTVITVEGRKIVVREDN